MNNPSAVVITNTYHPLEAAICRIALGLPPTVEDVDLDLWNKSEKLPASVIHLLPGFWGSAGEGLDEAASNALARIVLSGCEGQLPVFESVSRTGDSNTTRPPKAFREKAADAVQMALFEVNWADSGPGISWPEAYWLSWLPGFERWVVTASRDTPEVDGYCDRVLANFGQCVNPVATAGQRVCDYWLDIKSRFEQDRWAYLFETGRITENEAMALADKVWTRPKKRRV